jgi:hypothetical protein
MPTFLKALGMKEKSSFLINGFRCAKDRYVKKTHGFRYLNERYVKTSQAS